MTLSYRMKALRAVATTITYIGRPCKSGHSGERYFANQTCVECAAVQAAKFEQKRRQKLQGDPELRARRQAQKNEVSSRWRKTHRAEKSSEWAAWRAKKIQRTPAWANLQDIKDIYTAAAVVSRLTGISRHVDHIYPLNGRQVSGLHVVDNLQILRKCDNLSKGARCSVN